MLNPSTEDYLEVIYELIEEGEAVRQSQIAQRLKRRPASVSEMLDRLEGDGFIRREGRTVRLTDKGLGAAEAITRRHRLAERLLVDVIGVPWHLAHEEALKWEHVISEEVERRLVDLLGDPATCPHGNPIPGHSWGLGAPAEVLLTIAQLPIGARFELRRVTEKVEIESAWLKYLDENGLRPGARGEKVGVSPDGAIAVRMKDREVALGPQLAGELYVVATG